MKIQPKYAVNDKILFNGKVKGTVIHVTDGGAFQEYRIVWVDEDGNRASHEDIDKRITKA